MRKIKSLLLLTSFFMILISTVKSYVPPPVAFSSVVMPMLPQHTISQYNERDTDIVIDTIERYRGVVSSKLILDHLKERLPEAEINNLNIDRIIKYLQDAFKDDEDAIYRITRFREKNRASAN